MNDSAAFELPADLEAARPDVEAAMDEMLGIYLDAAEGAVAPDTAAALVAEIGARVHEAFADFTAAIEDYFAARLDAFLVQAPPGRLH